MRRGRAAPGAGRWRGVRSTRRPGRGPRGGGPWLGAVRRRLGSGVRGVAQCGARSGARGGPRSAQCGGPNEATTRPLTVAAGRGAAWEGRPQAGWDPGAVRKSPPEGPGRRPRGGAGRGGRPGGAGGFRGVRGTRGDSGGPGSAAATAAAAAATARGGGRGRGGAADCDRGQELDRVVVAGRAGRGCGGLRHGTAQFEGVAAGPAAVFVARHGHRLTGPARAGQCAPPRSSRICATTRLTVVRTASVSVRKCQ